MTDDGEMIACCATADDHDHADGRKRFDFILYGSMSVIVAAIALYYAGLDGPYLKAFAETALSFLKTMWWGVALGILVTGLMNKVPREYFQVFLGRGDTLSGVLRACLAGVLLDLCSHGILLVAVKLYERGASLAQVMAFLIASPWNSLSLTLVLVSLVGLNWTLVFIAGSVAVAVVSGLAYIYLTRRGLIPENPNHVAMPDGFSVREDMRLRWKRFRPDVRFFREVFTGSLRESKMLLRWLLFGVVIAAAIRAFVPDHMFMTYFGPSLLGLIVTLAITTIIEVCSEGSVPVAAEIFARAHAPGNAFAFLMAGVSTDYTEIMVLRDATKSWRVALSLPLVTVPQVVALGYVMNLFHP